MLFLNYLKENKYYVTVVLYFFISIILSLTNIIDITLPCLYTLIFDHHCPACGLTRSLIEIIKGNFKKSFEYNILTIPIIISFLYYIIKDFIQFQNRRRSI